MNEQSYERGHRAAHISTMLNSLRALGFDSAEEAELGRAGWIEERQAAVNALRDLCETFGDNDWPDELHLGDVIEKHLARPLYRNCPVKKTTPLFHDLMGGMCNITSKNR